MGYFIKNISFAILISLSLSIGLFSVVYSVWKDGVTTPNTSQTIAKITHENNSKYCEIGAVAVQEEGEDYLIVGCTGFLD